MQQQTEQKTAQIECHEEGKVSQANAGQNDPPPKHTSRNVRYVKIDKTDSSDAKIGDGAYGVVYRALDKVLNEKVALKRIKLENEEGQIFIDHHLSFIVFS